MRQSESIKTLTESLIKAQSEFTTLPKDKKGYGYNYTDLDTVISAVRPILAKYSLGFIQALTTLESGKPGITTRLISVGGEFLEDTIPLPEITVGKTNAAQNMGAAITYMKRYALCAILGISSDEDTDAVPDKNARQENKKPAFENMTTAAQLERKNAQKPQQPKAPELKGGADTPAQHNRIVELLRSKNPDGSPIFNKEDYNMVDSMRQQKTADEVIKFLEGMLKQPEQEENEIQGDVF